MRSADGYFFRPSRVAQIPMPLTLADKISIMPRSSKLALPFFALSVLLLATSLGVSSLLNHFAASPIFHSARLDDGPHHSVSASYEPIQIPAAFAASTLLLFCGSAALSRAVAFVKRERQRLFRRALGAALLAGTLFVGVQFHALSQLVVQLVPDEVPTGAGAFVAVVAALHAMHFIVALLCLVYVTVQALADRYDHEYYWGVTLCAWFWHALGLVWCVILATMGLAAF